MRSRDLPATGDRLAADATIGSWLGGQSVRRAIPVEVVLAHPTFVRRFAKPIQSVYRLDREYAQAIVELSGGLPHEADFAEWPR